MAQAQRMESLRKRHACIDTQLHEEETRPIPDAALVQQLKREKLLLKEELSKLESKEQEAA